MIVTADGFIRIANERTAQITEVPETEPEAIDSYDDPPPQAANGAGLPVEGGVFRDVIETGELVFDVEQRIIRADGGTLWLTVDGAPLRDASGALSAVIVGSADTTERKE